MSDEGSVHNALTDERIMRLLPGKYRNRRRCPWCPKDSGRKASHSGSANGASMLCACEWHIRMWVRDPRSLSERRRNR